jgi:hypothetical protein
MDPEAPKTCGLGSTTLVLEIATLQEVYSAPFIKKASNLVAAFLKERKLFIRKFFCSTFLCFLVALVTVSFLMSCFSLSSGVNLAQVQKV